MMFKAVNASVPADTDVVKLPAIVSAFAGIVFVTVPETLLKIRLPYASAATL